MIFQYFNNSIIIENIEFHPPQEGGATTTGWLVVGASFRLLAKVAGAISGNPEIGFSVVPPLIFLLKYTKRERQGLPGGGWKFGGG